MRMKFWAAAAALTLCLAAAAAAFFAAPYADVYATRRAARAGDAAALSRCVDFPVLRASLRKQVLAEMGDRLRREPENPFGNLAALLGPRIGEILLDRVATPDGFAALLRRHAFPAGRADIFSPAGKGAAADMHYAGRDTFVVTIRPSGGRPAVRLVYTRRGPFAWKLTDAHLPLK